MNGMNRLQSNNFTKDSSKTESFPRRIDCVADPGEDKGQSDRAFF
jgi:hypothetical protein